MKRTTALSALILAVATLTFTGCTMYKITGRGVIPIMLNTPQAKVDVLQHIDVSKMIAFDYTNSLDVSQILGSTLDQSKADAIINVSIEMGGDLGTFAVNLITLGIANAHTVKIQGDLVKLPNGLSFRSVPGSEVVAEAPTLEKLKMKLSNTNGFVSDVATMIARTPTGYALVRYDPSYLNSH